MKKRRSFNRFFTIWSNFQQCTLYSTVNSNVNVSRYLFKHFFRPIFYLSHKLFLFNARAGAFSLHLRVDIIIFTRFLLHFFITAGLSAKPWRYLFFLAALTTLGFDSRLLLFSYLFLSCVWRYLQINHPQWKIAHCACTAYIATVIGAHI